MRSLRARLGFALALLLAVVLTLSGLLYWSTTLARSYLELSSRMYAELLRAEHGMLTGTGAGVAEMRHLRSTGSRLADELKLDLETAAAPPAAARDARSDLPGRAPGG
jgi:hypothetical protein